MFLVNRLGPLGEVRATFTTGNCPPLVTETVEEVTGVLDSPRTNSGKTWTE